MPKVCHGLQRNKKNNHTLFTTTLLLKFAILPEETHNFKPQLYLWDPMFGGFSKPSFHCHREGGIASVGLTVFVVNLQPKSTGPVERDAIQTSIRARTLTDGQGLRPIMRETMFLLFPGVGIPNV